jgi:hypothetical protein
VVVVVMVMVIAVLLVVKLVAANYQVWRHHSRGKWQTNTHGYLIKLVPIR